MTDDASKTPTGDAASPAEALVAESLEAALTVRDLPASVAWYRDVLGFTVEREYHRDGRLLAVAVRAGAVQLLLGQDDGAKGAERARGDGFSLQLTTAQSVDAIAARIGARGGTLESEPADVWGVRRAFRLRDPDGFRFTISSPRGA
jgi:catechol 2,3-dioxygenase-like lactoylglutathione lyase family enzyme